MTLRVPHATLTRIFGGITAQSLLHDVQSRKHCAASVDRGYAQGCKSIVLSLQQSAVNKDAFIMDVVLADFADESCLLFERNNYSGTLLELGPYS